MVKWQNAAEARAPMADGKEDDLVATRRRLANPSVCATNWKMEK
jgi:hypothetical protein